MGGIIWLASYPKSGNTWMRAYLHNLLRNPPKPASINELDKFCLGESASIWFVGPAHGDVGPRDPMTLTAEEAMARRPVAHHLMTRVSKDSVFAKTHNMLGEWKGHPLHNMSVTAGGIYVVRNPLDVVLSMVDHFGVDIDGAIDRLSDTNAVTDLSADHVPEYHGSWSLHVDSWTGHPNPQLHVVRYEDLEQKPFKTFLGVAKFLGLNPPKERVNKAIKFASFKELKRQEQTGGFKERSEHADSFFGRGKSGNWRNVLSDEQVTRICTDHGAMMDKFGYLPKSHKHLASSAQGPASDSGASA